MGDSQTITTPEDHYRRGAELLASAENRSSDPVASSTLATLAHGHFTAASSASAIAAMANAAAYIHNEQRIEAITADCHRLAAELEQANTENQRLTNAQGWDPTSPEWAVCKAAIAYRKRVNDAAAPELHQLCQAIVTAVDALTEGVWREQL